MWARYPCTLIRNSADPGPYRRPMPRVLGGSYGGGRFLVGEVSLHGAQEWLQGRDSWRVSGPYSTLLALTRPAVARHVAPIPRPGFRIRIQRSGFRVQDCEFRVQATVSGFGVWGRGFGVWGLGSEVSGFGFRLRGFWIMGSGFGFRVRGFGFRDSGSWFRVSGVLFRVSGFGFRVSGSGFRGYFFGVRVYHKQLPLPHS